MEDGMEVDKEISSSSSSSECEQSNEEDFEEPKVQVRRSSRIKQIPSRGQNSSSPFSSLASSGSRSSKKRKFEQEEEELNLAIELSLKNNHTNNFEDIDELISKSKSQKNSKEESSDEDLEELFPSSSEDEEDITPKKATPQKNNNNNNKSKGEEKKKNNKKEKKVNKGKEEEEEKSYEKLIQKGKKKKEEEEELVVCPPAKKQKLSKSDTANQASEKRSEQTPRNPRRRMKSWNDLSRFARMKPTPSSQNSSSPLTSSSTTPSTTSSQLKPLLPFKMKGEKSRVQNRKKAPKKILSLQNMCINIVCDNIDSVESFGEIPDEIQNSISDELAKRGKLNTETINLFIGENIHHLSLRNCSELPPSDLRLLKQCGNLTKLSLHQIGRLNDLLLKELSDACPYIEDITIDGAYSLTDSSLIYFVQSHPNLKKIQLCWIYLFTRNFVEELIQACSKLTHISFAMCTQLTDSILEPLKKIEKLESFGLDFVPALTDEGLCSIFSKFGPGLSEVLVRNCGNLTDEFLFLTLSKSSHLKKLTLEALPKITDDGIHSFLPNCLQLLEINLNGCKNLTEKSISKVLLSCPNLQIMNIKGLNQLDKSAFIETCIPLMKNIVELNLSWCGTIDDSVLQELGEKRSHLRKLYLWGISVSDVMIASLLRKGIEVVGQDLFSLELISTSV